MIYYRKSRYLKFISIILSSLLVIQYPVSADILNGITAEELQADEYISDDYIYDESDDNIDNEYQTINDNISNEQINEGNYQNSNSPEETYVVVKTDNESLIDAPIVGQCDDLYMVAYPNPEEAEKGAEELNNKGAAACVDDYIYMADEFVSDDASYEDDSENYQEENTETKENVITNEFFD